MLTQTFDLIKRSIKKIRPLYYTLLWVRKFVVAFLAVRLDVFPLKEFIVSISGKVALGKDSYRFFHNFMERSVLNSNNKFHFIDVGANEGGFASIILRFYPDAKITAYEPLLSQHSYLEKLQKKYPGFSFRKTAVGAKRNSAIITEYEMSGLSSLVKINPKYKYFDKLQSIASEYPVEVVSIDDEIVEILSEQFHVDEKRDVEVVLKIDTQGYELEVLRGAKNSLSNGLIKWIIIELMTVEKYTGGCLYDEVFSFLHQYGYRMWDMNLFYYEPDTLRLTEFDAIFVREDDQFDHLLTEPPK